MIETDLEDYHKIDVENSQLKLIHFDNNVWLNFKKAEETKNAKYVGEFCLNTVDGGWANQPFSLFYQTEPHPQGSNYFAVYQKYDLEQFVDLNSPPHIMITNGISAVEDKDGNPIVYDGIVIDDKYVLYSAYRHDYQSYNNYFIDGGREYCRGNTTSQIQFIIKNGKIELYNV